MDQVAPDAIRQFDLNEDQRAIREMAQSFAQEQLAPRAIEWDQEKHFPSDVLRKAAAVGMGGIYTREDFGGSGLTRLEAALIFEALASGCPSVAADVSMHNMVTWMIDRFGDEAQRTRFVPSLCTMDHFGSYCLTEPAAGSDAAALRMRAVKDGNSYVLNGVKQFISGAGISDAYIVMARTGNSGPAGVSAFIIQKGTPGLSFGANEKKMGWNAQPTRQVICEDCRVPASNLLGAEGQGFKIAMALPSGKHLLGALTGETGLLAAAKPGTLFMIARPSTSRARGPRMRPPPRPE